MNRIILLCMGKKGYQVVHDIIEALGSEVICFIVGARDLKVENDYYDEIARLAKKHNVVFYEKESKWENSVGDEYVFAVSWRWLINIRDVKKLIIAHDSLLPKYRGFSPLVNMLINNESEIGVTFLLGSNEYDAGDIILQKRKKITYPIKIIDAIDLIALSYSECLIEVVKNIQYIKSTPQDHSKATYSLWRGEEDYLINFNDSADNIKRFIDAVGFPYKGAAAYINNEKVRVLDVKIFNDVKIEGRDSHLGKVIFLDKSYPVIICKHGLLKLYSVISDKSGESILPLKYFRTKFRGKNENSI